MSPVHITCLGFVFDPAAQAIIRRVAPAHFSLRFFERADALDDATLRRCDVIMSVAPVTDAMMRSAPRLRLIQKWGVGYDKIDVDAARRHGIAVAVIAGVNANTIAEHAVTLMLTVMRRIVVADHALRQGRWIPAELRPRAQRLYGKTVGIVGFGNIGRAVARQLQGFATETLYFKRGGPVADEASLKAHYVPLDELYARSDVVTLHCPGGSANRGMIDRVAIEAMKPGGVLVNTARGDLVVEDDLVDALQRRRLSGAGLDVFAEEPLRPGSRLRNLDTVVLTPHSAGSMMEDVARMAAHGFENIEGYLRGDRIRPADLVVDPPRPRAVAPASAAT